MTFLSSKRITGLLILFAALLTSAAIAVHWHWRLKGKGRKEDKEDIEGFAGHRCPNLLVRRGCRFYLFNTKLAQVPGVNPVVFNNLGEYTEFLDWQRGAGIRCPVLYLQQSYDARGHRVYVARPSVDDPQGGLTEKDVQNILADVSEFPPPVSTDKRQCT